MTAKRPGRPAALFASARYPELLVADLNAVFKAGLLEVQDPAVADGLRALPVDLGVAEVPPGSDPSRYLTPGRATVAADVAGTYQGRLAAAQDVERTARRTAATHRQKDIP